MQQGQSRFAQGGSWAFILLVIAVPKAVHAQAAAQNRAAVLSASPDAPTTAILWRGQLRGKVAAVVPLWGDANDFGTSLRLPALIELANVEPSAVPYQTWRGRIWLEAGHRWRLHLGPIGGAFKLSIALEHESAHPSLEGYVGFINLNSVAIRDDLTLPLASIGATVTLSILARGHFLTCTWSRARCGAGAGAGLARRRGRGRGGARAPAR